MSAILQLRRGTEEHRKQIIPEIGEPIYCMDTKKVYIGDGITPGGVYAPYLETVGDGKANLVYRTTNIRQDFSTFNRGLVIGIIAGILICSIIFILISVIK